MISEGQMNISVMIIKITEKDDFDTRTTRYHSLRLIRALNFRNLVTFVRSGDRFEHKCSVKSNWWHKRSIVQKTAVGKQLKKGHR